MSNAVRERLLEGLSLTTQTLTATQTDQLVALVALLHKWNRVYNLTAVRDPVQMVSRHLLDSLVLSPYLSTGSLLDIGSGAGLPGLPLAIALPDLSCTLLDSNGKKTRFIQHAVTELGLPNVEVVQSRIEDANLPPVDTVVSRAFSSPLDIITAAGSLCRPGGTILFMLGQVDESLQSLPEGYQLDRIDSVNVPFEEGARHIAMCKVINPNHL